jgi:hypothetical protein
MSATTEQAAEAPPIQLNAKQQDRIQKRRIAREKLIAHLALTRKSNKTHNPGGVTGCMRRPRGPDGRFLIPEQITTKQMECRIVYETKETPKERPMVKPKL